MKFDKFGKAGDYSEPEYTLDPIVYTLRKARYDQDVSQKVLAKRMNWSARSLRDAERGMTSPSFHIMKIWAKTLGYTLELTK